MQFRDEESCSGTGIDVSIVCSIFALQALGLGSMLGKVYRVWS
jgi:hypothetical protein